MPSDSLVIEQFLEHYGREIDHFSELARISQRRIEAALSKHGIPAIATSRAKSTMRLREKLQARNLRKSYQDVSDIYEDIIDLAGVRIALYFPSDRAKIDSLLGEIFEFSRDPKTFPESNSPKPDRRFLGYFATHYLVRLKPDLLNPDQARFTSRIEVQVASVLMHAWAEVEHDLQYKPESGELSEDEVSVLDELNGLVLSGELALERLQRAIQRRTESSKNFDNGYELASILSLFASRLGFRTKDVGKVDLLFRALKEVNRNSASGLTEFVKNFSDDEMQSPIADVIMDRVLAYDAFTERERTLLQTVISHTASVDSADKQYSAEGAIAIEAFLNTWKEVERILRREIAGESDIYRSFGFVLKEARLKPLLMGVVQEARFIRNQLVHGIEPPPTTKLIDITKQMTESLLPVLRAEAARRNATSSKRSTQLEQQ